MGVPHVINSYRDVGGYAVEQVAAILRDDSGSVSDGRHHH
jgi:hypothetical protein